MKGVVISMTIMEGVVTPPFPIPLLLVLPFSVFEVKDLLNIFKK